MLDRQIRAVALPLIRHRLHASRDDGEARFLAFISGLVGRFGLNRRWIGRKLKSFQARARNRTFKNAAGKLPADRNAVTAAAF